jgi:predicted RecB family nuclease
MRSDSGTLVFAPSDLIRYFASPFASWMDRYHLENPGAIVPDEDTEDQKLVAQTGDQHEQRALNEYKRSAPGVVEIARDHFDVVCAQTLAAITSGASIVYQAGLQQGVFAGYSDFLILDANGRYQVWDAKLARSPKPYYAIQLCCYSEMLAAVCGTELPKRFGIILGGGERLEFRVEEFIHYYRRVKSGFLALQDGFTGMIENRPEPAPRAEHGPWGSHAERFFAEKDHVVQVAGISVGQIKKLRGAGITTVAQLSTASGTLVPKLSSESLEKLAAQARLQRLTREDRAENPDALPRTEILSCIGDHGEPVGLATLPTAVSGDVYFDMEGYPLTPGGLEYLFGACSRNPATGSLELRDWWAHDRDQEKVAFEGFVDWAFGQWKTHPGMHIYHYAAYEVSAIRRLSTRHDSRQDEVDELLRNEVFVDLYQIVRRGLRIGEDSYSLKKVEALYRPRRATEVANAAASIVQYARWKESGEDHDCNASGILKAIRDYNEDDCKSTAELVDWLRATASQHGIAFTPRKASADVPSKAPSSAMIYRQSVTDDLRRQGDPVSVTLADLVDFHRREQKPMWWRMFDRAKATPEELRDDPACLEGLQARGDHIAVKQSCVQAYAFDPAQECKIAANDSVMFTHDLKTTFTVSSIDASLGELKLKIGRKGLTNKCDGSFAKHGSVLKDEFVSAEAIAEALCEVAYEQSRKRLSPPVEALLMRRPPAAPMRNEGETTLAAAIRITPSMSGGCLVIQGPPGTGKTYTAAGVIAALVDAGKRVGITSNSHKAIGNLLAACGEATSGGSVQGIKVGGEEPKALLASNPGLTYLADSNGARDAYTTGVAAGTAWLFARPEWKDTLDFLFIDEAGQVSLANAVAIARSARNLVLLGDQMQLEQPVQGSHPGDAGMSVLQYALKDPAASVPDAPVFHAVVPPELGLFLGESRRMHPEVCRFISESIYEGRLDSHPDCAKQWIAVPPGAALIKQEAGIVFSGVEHDCNIQDSEEEVERVKAIYAEMLGRDYATTNGAARTLKLEDFLFVAPYNAQVRALQQALPGARVGSVDKFQGQEAAVCILSLCSSFGEYGSRGLAFILDRNRVNVAVSRAKCLAIVVGDPRIADSPAGSIGDMRLLNIFCKLVGERHDCDGGAVPV